MPSNALVIFIKNPELGKVKTRLAATIGAEKALEIYLELINLTLKTVENIEADKFIFFSDRIENTIGNDLLFNKLTQKGNNLGLRMNNAFETIFLKEYKKIVLIGTDCPGISVGIIEQAFEELSTKDVAIGPAKDGGYYLVALNKHFKEIFEGIAWSTSTVFDETITRCQRHQKSFAVLEELSDVDEEKDLEGLNLW